MAAIYDPDPAHEPAPETIVDAVAEWTEIEEDVQAFTEQFGGTDGNAT